MRTHRLALLAIVAISPVALNAKDPQARTVSAPQAAPPSISREQMGTDMGLTFDKHDKDQDGYLSWQEWEESNRESPEFGAKTVFDRFDRDRDNRLARQEMVDWSQRMFDCLDANHDGRATNPEMETRFQFCMMAETGVVPQ
jgi:hypothetical protein